MLRKPLLYGFLAGAVGLNPFQSAAGARIRQCPPLGPVLPAPKRPSQHPAVISAIEAITATLQVQIGGFNYSAVSIGVKSIHEDAPLLEVHHTPAHLNSERGAELVNSSTVYRIGSISKVFAVLAALQLAEDGLLSMHDPVGRWIPELVGPDRDASGSDYSEHELDEVDWDGITVEAVAAHMAGIGADISTDLAAFDGDWEALGLPKIPLDMKRPDCSGIGGIRPCTREDLLEAYQHRRPPVYPPNQSPVYSNSGTALVGLVVEAASNKSFETVLQEKIVGPLGMRHTTLGNVPDNMRNMFIPVGGTDWDRNLGVFDPAGGINSNTQDLLAFMTAILRNQVLPPSSTRRWLKPATFTSGWSGAVGAPWEIYRLDNLTSDGRIIDLYTKGGTLTDYHAMSALVPDSGLVLSVLASGPEVMGFLPQLVAIKLIEALIPAMDLASREETIQNLAGRYADEATDSRLTLALDDDGPGLVLSDWVVRGVEVLPSLDRYHPSRVNDTTRSELKSVRLFPTGLESQRRSAWRATFPSFTDEDAQLIDAAIPVRDATCVSWFMADRLTYNYLSMDHFEFQFGDGETAVSIKSKAFDVEMARVSKENPRCR